MIEKSLILIKHDAVSRGLIGEIITRFEKTGLKIIGMKMLHADEKLASNHYVVNEEWAKAVFEKTKNAYEKNNKDFPFKNPMEYGKMIQEWNVGFLREGPIIAIVLEGPHAIEIARKIVGNTEPRQALPGTIRGDYTFESYAVADLRKRPVRNLVHASGSVKEAEREISLWFKDNELCSYTKELDKHYK